MKKIKILKIITFCMLIFCLPLSLTSFLPTAQTCAIDGDVEENYVVFDEENQVLCERSSIEEGDSFVSKDFYEYQIYKIDGKKGYAKKIRRLNVPSIKREDLKPRLNARGSSSNTICLYMTHNDESYVPSDGYDSIYGAGGIHDVAKKLQKSLQNKGINVVLDETLHIPHNSSAYSRSSVTANKLFKSQKPDAMFDIHRDGVSKSYYYTKQGNTDLSKVRIVVGKSNPNFDQNYEFALKVFALGNSMYPWLFSDVYCGKGHYNQELQSTNLLFEMGTYLIEKDYVYNTIPYLADVVDTALYASQEDEKGDIIVDENAPETSESPIVNQVASKKNEKSTPVIVWVAVGVITALIGFSGVVIAIEELNKKRKKSLKK